jgi:TM2 domain-containing membrane protein YozV
MIELQTIISSIPDGYRDRFFSAFIEREKNPVVAFGCNCFLGWLGVDRFYVGDTILGLVKLVTIGGLGIWTFVDYFLIAQRAREKNMRMARELKNSLAPIQII